MFNSCFRIAFAVVFSLCSLGSVQAEDTLLQGAAPGVQVPFNSAVSWPSPYADNRANIIDNNTSTFSWTVISQTPPQYVGFGFAGSSEVNRLRIWKTNESGNSPPIGVKDWIIQYTTDNVATGLASRTWQNVTNMSTGFDGEIMTATSVNPDGTILEESHNSPATGWASLTFDAVNATGFRIAFQNSAVIPPNSYIHLHLNEVQAFFEPSLVATVTPEPSSLLLGALATVLGLGGAAWRRRRFPR